MRWHLLSQGGRPGDRVVGEQRDRGGHKRRRHGVQPVNRLVRHLLPRPLLLHIAGA